MTTAAAHLRPSRRIRRRCYEILERAVPQDATAAGVHAVLIALVLVNVAAVVLESVPSVSWRFGPLFIAIEIVSIVAFSAEYLLRLWCAPEHPPWRRLPPWRAYLAFVVQPQAVVDLLAVAPFYLAFFLPGDLRTLLVLRLFRFFKLARYSPGLASLMDAVYAERRALLACCTILLGTVLIAASAMHLAEHAAQPDKFGTIPDAMYWAVITLTTVGYGDVTPVTGLGRVIAGLTAVAGLIMLALPVGIIASAFAREIHRHDFVVTWSMVARVPIFADLDAAEVSEIMRHLRAQTCEPDEIIVRRGEPADSMYFITSGEVEIQIDGPTRLGAGQFFGELALLRRTKRTATAKACERCKLLVLAADDLHHLMERSPRMARSIREVARARAPAERIGRGGDLWRDELQPPDEERT